MNESRRVCPANHFHSQSHCSLPCEINTKQTLPPPQTAVALLYSCTQWATVLLGLGVQPWVRSAVQSHNTSSTETVTSGRCRMRGSTAHRWHSMTSLELNNKIEQLMRWFCIRLSTSYAISVIPTLCIFTVGLLFLNWNFKKSRCVSQQFSLQF